MSEHVYLILTLLVTSLLVLSIVKMEPYKDKEENKEEENKEEENKEEKKEKGCESCDEYNVNKSSQYKKIPSLANPSESCQKTISERNDNSVYNGYYMNPKITVFKSPKNYVDGTSPYSKILKDIPPEVFPEYQECKDFKRCWANGVAVGKQGVIP